MDASELGVVCSVNGMKVQDGRIHVKGRNMCSMPQNAGGWLCRVPF